MESARCKAFLAAVETGSFTRAAEKLNYTTSGVSQLVAALEKELGITLFIRKKQGVALSVDGEHILPLIRSFVQQEERIYQSASEIRGLSVGEITVAAYPSMSAHWLPLIIRQFQNDYPQIQVNLMEGIRQEIITWLEDGVADIGFLSMNEDSQFDWFPVYKDRMIAVLPKDHPLAHADRYPIALCEKEKFIMPALGRDDDVVDMFARYNVHPNIQFSTMENYSAISMIEKGLGMSIMNERSTFNWVSDVVKLPLEPPEDITLGMAVPSLEHASSAARKFVEYARKESKLRINDEKG